MNAHHIIGRWSAGVLALFLAAAAVAAQPAPRDYTLHHSPLLTMASPGSPIRVEPTDGGRAQVRLTTKGGHELLFVADSFTVAMSNGGFVLAGTGAVVLSGAYSLKAQSVALRVSADGRSSLEVKQGVKP